MYILSAVMFFSIFAIWKIEVLVFTNGVQFLAREYILLFATTSRRTLRPT
jgi:hypothetical protein